MAGSSWHFWCPQQLGELCTGRPTLCSDAWGCAGLAVGPEPSRGWGLSVCIPHHGMVQPCPASPQLALQCACPSALWILTALPQFLQFISQKDEAPPAAPCIPLGLGLQLRPVGSGSSAAPSCLPLSPAFLIREALESLPLSLTSRGRQSEREFGWEITHQGSCLLCRASNQLRNNNWTTKIS